MPAWEFLELKPSDDEMSLVREIQAERILQRDAHHARLAEEEIPILEDLRAAGFAVNHVWSLGRRGTNYAAAIPILLKHLALPYLDPIKGDIARQLAVPTARYAWRTLVDEFRKVLEENVSSGHTDTPAKQSMAEDALAQALCATVTKETMDELIEIAGDPAFGGSRTLLLSVIKRQKSPKAKAALRDFATDPVHAREISTWGRSSPFVQYAWQTLALEYRQIAKTENLVAQSGALTPQLRYKIELANDLCASTTSDTIGELIALAKDPELGAGQAVLLRAIKRSRVPEVKAAWPGLEADPKLATVIASLRRN